MSRSSRRRRVSSLRQLSLVSAYLAASTLSLLLAGCWWPEKFDASLQVNQDRSYVFRYDGLLTFTPAAAEAKSAGRLEPRTELELNDAAKKLASEDGFKSVNYLGNGRYQVTYEKTGIIDHEVDLLGESLKVLTLRPTQDGIEIKGRQIDDDTRKQLAQIGVGLDGNVRVQSALKVTEQNAQETPLLGGMVGSYKWRLNLDTPPVRLSLSQSPALPHLMEKSTFFVVVLLALLVAVIVAARLAARRSKKPEFEPV